MDPGIYTLVLRLDGSREIGVGSLGKIFFRPGYYSYTGSARGSGGLKRVERHLEVINGNNLCRRWHIDYLLPYTSLIDVVKTHTTVDLECEIACAIGEKLEVLKRFGSTDCSCLGHLHYSSSLDEILQAVRAAHELCR